MPFGEVEVGEKLCKLEIESIRFLHFIELSENRYY